MQLSRSGDAGGAQSLSLRQGLGRLCPWLQVEGLCHQVKELQEEVSSLHSIRDNEKEIDQIFSNALQLQEPRLPTVLKGGGSGRVCACLFGKWRLP